MRVKIEKHVFFLYRPNNLDYLLSSANYIPENANTSGIAESERSFPTIELLYHGASGGALVLGSGAVALSIGRLIDVKTERIYRIR